MTDKERVAEIMDKLSSLNAAISSAVYDGLEIVITAKEVHAAKRRTFQRVDLISASRRFYPEP